MFRVVVTLLILTVAVDATRNPQITEITADLRFECRLDNRFMWKYQVVFLEYDFGRAHDVLHRSKVHRAFSSNPRNRFVFNASGGDGIFDSSYEIYAHVVHNCTPSGKKIVAKFFLGDVGTFRTSEYLRKTLTLY
ncbi:unnamed protein product [Caenorhabditis angaria]|uniref:Uncharacterized protein n=1 Tax=Caenorhabditis angaria TaxID=860376 RepID=A0A9P1I9E9_9PELO|nr:unnamed protein product [Caenorhabditis angaria]